MVSVADLNDLNQVFMALGGLSGLVAIVLQYANLKHGQKALREADAERERRFNEKILATVKRIKLAENRLKRIEEDADRLVTWMTEEKAIAKYIGRDSSSPISLRPQG